MKTEARSDWIEIVKVHSGIPFRQVKQGTATLHQLAGRSGGGEGGENGMENKPPLVVEQLLESVLTSDLSTARGKENSLLTLLSI